MSKELTDKMAEVLARHAEYRRGAYEFLERSIGYTQEKLGRHAHVSAHELLIGFRELAEREFGALAQAVLHDWGVYEAKDVGKMVYYLIDAGVFSASPEDKQSDFDEEFKLASPPEIVESLAIALDKII